MTCPSACDTLYYNMNADELKRKSILGLIGERATYRDAEALEQMDGDVLNTVGSTMLLIQEIIKCKAPSDTVAIFRAILNPDNGVVFDGSETVAMLSMDDKGNIRLACKNSEHDDLVNRVLTTIREGMAIALEEMAKNAKRPLRTFGGEIH